VIAQMEQRLLQGSNGTAGLDAPASSIQQLEAENASLRQALHAMQSRLAGGGQPARDDGNRSSSGGDLTMPDLQARLARLQASMQIKEEQHRRQLSSLRQEHERLRVQEGIRCDACVGGTGGSWHACSLLPATTGCCVLAVTPYLLQGCEPWGLCSREATGGEAGAGAGGGGQTAARHGNPAQGASRGGGRRGAHSSPWCGCPCYGCRAAGRRAC
jgi:outer membrane murein-binding lipoprotein Lpp